MNPYLMSLPTLIWAAIMIILILRTLRRSQLADAIHETDFKQRMTILAQYRAELQAQRADHQARSQAELHVKLDLSDEEACPDLPLATHQAQPLVSALSEHEQALGGLGLTLTGAKVEAGSVRLTLSPRERVGSAARLQRLAAEVNATTSPLPPGVTAAHADILAL
jgi:hypothetical protein